MSAQSPLIRAHTTVFKFKEDSYMLWITHHQEMYQILILPVNAQVWLTEAKQGINEYNNFILKFVLIAGFDACH